MPRFLSFKSFTNHQLLISSRIRVFCDVILCR